MTSGNDLRKPGGNTLDEFEEYLEIPTNDETIVDQFEHVFRREAAGVPASSPDNSSRTLAQVLEECRVDVRAGEPFPGGDVVQVIVIHVAVPLGVGIVAAELREILRQKLYPRLRRAFGAAVRWRQSRDE